MSREYTPFAKLETTFILSDPRYKTLAPTAKVLYIALWARAFQDRRGTLPNWYDTAAMQEDCRLDARTIVKSVTMLQQRCLIKREADGRITVVGVHGKGNIKWKDAGEDFGEEIGNGHATTVSDKRREEKSIYSPVWDAWIAAKILDRTLVCSPVDVQAMKEATALYSAEQIIEAIENYSKILHGDWILTTRWTLKNFLERNMTKFFTGSNPFETYKKFGSPSGGTPAPKEHPARACGSCRKKTDVPSTWDGNLATLPPICVHCGVEFTEGLYATS